MTLDALDDRVARSSLHEELIGRLRLLIIRGDLVPGTKVPEKKLCARFDVSRTPLREALKVLASEGLVDLLPNRGAQVHRLTSEELAEVVPIMEALETLTGELACQNATDREIDEIRDLQAKMVQHWEKGEREAYFALNQQIHLALLAATRNHLLGTLYRATSTRLMSTRYRANISSSRWAEAVQEHELILDALAKRDGPLLARILKSHLSNTLAAVGDSLRASETVKA